jgi:hypothetical protein
MFLLPMEQRFGTTSSLKPLREARSEGFEEFSLLPPEGQQSWGCFHASLKCVLDTESESSGSQRIAILPGNGIGKDITAPFSLPLDRASVDAQTEIMIKAELQQEAMALPAAEKLELVLELWDSSGAESVPVPDWHREAILERLGVLEERSTEERSAPWEEGHQRVFSEGA